jgi:hypothetical protein
VLLARAFLPDPSSVRARGLNFSFFHQLQTYYNERTVSIAKKYTKGHEWVSYDDETSIATISITDYAQRSLGDVVFVELPTVGEEVAAEGMSLRASFLVIWISLRTLMFSWVAEIGAVESVKAASDIVRMTSYFYLPMLILIWFVTDSLFDLSSMHLFQALLRR